MQKAAVIERINELTSFFTRFITNVHTRRSVYNTRQEMYNVEFNSDGVFKK